MAMDAGEIERLIREAETSAETDKEVREAIALRNKLESLVKNTQRTFLEFGGLLSDNDQQIGTRVLSEGEAAINSKALEEIGRALDGVERLAKQLTTAMMNPETDAAVDEVEEIH